MSSLTARLYGYGVSHIGLPLCSVFSGFFQITVEYLINKLLMCDRLPWAQAGAGRINRVCCRLCTILVHICVFVFVCDAVCPLSALMSSLVPCVKQHTLTHTHTHTHSNSHIAYLLVSAHCRLWQVSTLLSQAQLLICRKISLECC